MSNTTTVYSANRHGIENNETSVIVGTRAYLTACKCDLETIGKWTAVPIELINAEGKYIGKAL